MAYIAPIHRPSSIRHALKLNLTSPDEECLVVAKANRLEIYNQTQDGLTLHHSRAIYGKITALNKLRPASSQTDHLFVSTDRYHYFTLAWDTDTKQLRTEKSYADASVQAARDSQTGDRCHIDPTGRLMTLEIFEGVVTVVPIVSKGKKKTTAPMDLGNLGDPLPTRIPEMFVRSSCFLHRRNPQTDKPTLALLHEDGQAKVRLKLRQVQYTGGDPGEADLDQDVEAPFEELELGASMLIPVPEPSHGVLILGETSISYYDDAGGELVTRPLDDATIFVAWEKVDNQRFLLSDEYGRLFLLMLLPDSHGRLDNWVLDQLGETSRAETLVYLDAGHVFLGSHQGDSQVIRISEKSMEVVQSFPNIAPILDFTIMDMGNRSGEGKSNEYSSGQARIVTGSGAYKDGSLRSVRSGVGLEDLGSLGQFDHISNLFSLKSSASSELTDTLLVSFITESRIFRFSDDGEVEEVEKFAGLSTADNTLHASILPGGRVLQVTASRVQVTDAESGMVIGDWTPDQAITAVASNERYVVVAAGGLQLVVLDVNDGVKVHTHKTFGADRQVSCVALPSAIDEVCLVGSWQGSTVSILDFDSLESIQSVQIDQNSTAVPRNIVLTQIFHDRPPTVFIAMSDGNVVTFSVDPMSKTFSGRESIVLGAQQANFRELARGDGLYNIFATCEHPSLIYGSEGRLVFSAVTAEDATCVCPFDSVAYPGAVAIATNEDLKIAIVDTERTTHVQTLRVSETVRRIAYSPSLKAFGLGTIKRQLLPRTEDEPSREIVHSHFKLADEIMFKELDTYDLNAEELVESVMRCDLDDGTGSLAERFVVGTTYLDDDDGENVRGRILVLEVTPDRTLKLVTELALKGACRCLAICEGNIVAALIKTVVIYAFEYQTPSQPFLVKKATYRTSTAPIDIQVTGNQIAIADLMKSVSILTYTHGKTGLPDKLTEVARHYQTTWSTAVADVGENAYLESDAEGNLLVLQRDKEALTEDDRRRLQVTSEFNLGEMVNRIRTIDVPVREGAVVVPRAFMATVEGSLYLFALINPAHQNTLMTLQQNLADYVETPGHVPFMSYRAYKSQVRQAEEPMRFVDGDLIERFLNCDEEVQQRAVEGLGVGVDEVKIMVEQLRRLH